MDITPQLFYHRTKMTDRNDSQTHSLKSSSEENDVSTRQQLNLRQEQLFQPRRNSQCCQRMVISPATAAAPHDNSLLLHEQQDRGCAGCVQYQKRLSQMQWQLKMERGKGKRLSKIITYMKQKEEQLNKAYLHFAMTVNKKMAVNSSNICQINQQQSRERQQESRIASEELGNQVYFLEMEVKRLQGQVQEWKLRCEKVQSAISSEEILSPSSYRKEEVCEEKILNTFFQKEIERLHQKIGELEFQLNQGKRQNCCEINKIESDFIKITQKENLKINETPSKLTEQKQEENKQLTEINEINHTQKAQKSELKQNSKEKFDESLKQLKKIQSKENKSKYKSFDSFYSMEQIQNSFIPILQGSQISAISVNKLQSKASQQYLDSQFIRAIRNSDHSQSRLSQSFKTVVQYISDSFESLYSKQDLSQCSAQIVSARFSNILKSSFEQSELIEEERHSHLSQFYTIIEQADFEEVSSVRSQIYTSSVNHTQKQFRQMLEQNPPQSLQNQQEHSVYQRKKKFRLNRPSVNFKDHFDLDELKTQIEIQRQKMNNFKEVIRHFFQKLALTLNKFGESQNIQFKLPLLPHFNHTSLKIQDNNCISSLQDLNSKQAQQCLADILTNFQKLAKNTKNKFDKLINDKDLQTKQLIFKLSELQEQNNIINKRLKKLEDRNSHLQFEISDLSSQLPANEPISHQTQRNSILRSVFHKKINQIDQQRTDQGVNCHILSSNTQQIMQKIGMDKQRLEEGLQYLPQILNQIMNGGQLDQSAYKLNLQKSIEEQIQTMIKDCFFRMQAVFQQLPQIVTTPSARKQSSSLSQIMLFRDEDDLYILAQENEQLQNINREKSDRITDLSSKLALQKMQVGSCNQQIGKLREQINGLNKIIIALHNEASIFSNQKSQLEAVTPTPLKCQTLRLTKFQQGQFHDYSQRKQFNNLHWDRDEEMRELRNQLLNCKNQMLRIQVEKSKRKKKTIYIDK